MYGAKIDFNNSFITVASKSKGFQTRFTIEAYMRSNAEYYLCCPCKGENTFEGAPLIKIPHYDYFPIFSKKSYRWRKFHHRQKLTSMNLPFTLHIEYKDNDFVEKLTLDGAELQFPIKTFNTNNSGGRQIDTGYILMPDLRVGSLVYDDEVMEFIEDRRGFFPPKREIIKSKMDK